ncbi:unnamed protein product [Macrosiphum euphorbiae]|uniref:Uncharacterized protein n=1 Tax=Macrosiphum euphorbiae TaxID=13131 RepID=A0AAV0VUM6_9HEMI|nr:unnamed protein product [Macrosiphum euphorbiae]
MKDGVVMDPVVLEEAQQLLSPASWTKGDICPKNARKRYNVTILELNPVVGPDDVVVDHCRRRESSTSTGGVNDGLQSSCSECTDRSHITK